MQQPQQQEIKLPQEQPQQLKPEQEKEQAAQQEKEQAAQKPPEQEPVAQTSQQAQAQAQALPKAEPQAQPPPPKMQSDFYKKMSFSNPKQYCQPTAVTEKSVTPVPAQAAAGAAARPEPKEEAKEPEELRTEYLFKHPLQNTWTLWYLEQDRTKTWEERQNEITSFDTVEDFWSLYNHIKPPSEIKVGNDYSLFKKPIRPMWEDDANKQGGRWVITVHKSSKADLDNLWLDVLLCIIGEAFDNSDAICGAIVNLRNRNNKICIWTANGADTVAVLEIGHKLKEALRLGHQNLEYQLHKDTMVKQGANVKAIHTL